MRPLLLILVAGCAGEVCEPDIGYRAQGTDEVQAPGPDGEGCASLMFAEEPIPVEWYPEGTRGLVRECHDNSQAVRVLECFLGAWRPPRVPG